MASRVAYRRALARDLGGSTVATTTGNGTSTTFQLTSHFSSSMLPATALAYQWVFVPAFVGTGQARIASNGLNPATGVVTLDGALQGSVMAGTTVELHSRLPAVEDSYSHLGGGSLDQCVNRALRHLFIEDDSTTLPLVSGAFDYSLTDYGDILDHPERLVGVRQANGAGTTTHETFHRWELRERASDPVLHFFEPFAFVSGAPVVNLVIRRPAFSLIAVGGTWATSTTGLVSETDEAKPSINDVTTVALYFAYQNLAARNQGAARAGYLARAEAQLALAQRVKGFEMATEEAQPATAPIPVEVA